MKTEENLIAVGSIRTSWGLDGWLKLSSYSGEWDHFRSIQAVFLRYGDAGPSREYAVEGFRIHQDCGQIKLAGVDSPEAGKTLCGSDILVPREHAAVLGEDEWYIRDLIGLSLVDENGRSIGEVISVIESSDDILEIEPPDGRRFLIPFRREFVEEPDLENGTLALIATWILEQP